MRPIVAFVLRAVFLGVFMIRRSLAVAVLAGATVLAPMTAVAAPYPAPESALTCSETTVTTGTVFTCSIQGPAGESATLTATTTGTNASIAGVVSTTKTIPDTNSAVFSITAPDSAATISFAGTVGAAPTNSATVIVAPQAAGPGTTGTANTDVVSGGANMYIAFGAAALLAMGGVALAIGARRRKRASD